MTTMQDVMNRAYDKWQANLAANAADPTIKAWEYPDFLDELDALERRVVVIGNLNYQVCNGGFSQWIGNGYMGDTADQVLRVLDRAGTEATKTVADLVRQARKRHEGANEYAGRRRGWRDDDEADEPDYNDLDDVFYSVNGRMLADVAAHLGLTHEA